MIITRTPYRVSFAGGGSDLPAYCDREPGMVVSTTIDRHIYVQVSRRFESDWTVRYGRSEVASDPSMIFHPIVRECLLLHGIKDHLEIVITGDLPGGLGLGSSGALTVGLLAALDALRGRRVDAKALAQQACLVEMGRLKKPIGYQDAYAAAFGGLNEIRFKGRGNNWVEPLRSVTDQTRRMLEAHALLVRVGEQRSADEILERQGRGISESAPLIREMVDLAGCARDSLVAGDMKRFGAILDRNWFLKKALAEGISTMPIFEAYSAAIGAGIWGGKLLGAGGGGFLLLLAPPERHGAIRDALGRLKELPFRMSTKGVEVIYNDEVPG